MRLLAFMADEKLRALALKRMQMANVYCAEVADFKVIERLLIELGIKKKGNHDPVFTWLENEDFMSTRRSESPVELIHSQGHGPLSIASAFICDQMPLP